MIDLSIIVVNRNTRALLADALSALPDACAEIAHEIIVVDNASTDGSPALVRERFPRAQLILNDQNLGFARANNQGLRSAQGELILLLNSDTRARPGSIADLIHFMRQQPRAGIAGPRLLNADGLFQGSAADFPRVANESLLLLGGLSRRLRGPAFPYHSMPIGAAPRRVDWVSGACLLIRRAVIEQIGELDEEFFMYTEETDWCYRAQRAGWQVWWLPGPTVTHIGGATAQHTFARKRRQVYGSKTRFFRKHYGRPAAWTFGAIVWLTSLVKAAGWGAMAIIGSTERRRSAGANLRSYLEVIGHNPARSEA